MEKKKEINISLKMVVIIIIILLMIAVGIIVYLKSTINNEFIKGNNNVGKETTTINNELGKEESNIVGGGNEIPAINNELGGNNNTEKEEYYYYSDSESITPPNGYKKVSNIYSGEYDIQYKTLNKTDDLSSFKVCEYMDYSNYIKYCDKWNLNKKYNYEDYNYIMFSYYCSNESNIYLEEQKGTKSIEAELAGLEYNNEQTTLYIWDGNITSTTEDIYAAYIIIIPTKEKTNNVNYIGCINSTMYDALNTTIDKPIIYLYPTKEMKVSVKLLKDENLTCSYPKYKNKWNVLAQPNGNLKDLKTGRQLYSLYYESKNKKEFKVEKDGFVVKGEDTIKFLEEKLAILGLTDREAEEFIVYWLPKLEANKYNYIRFATLDEINENMPIEINPKPDIIIRVVMTFKGLDKPINVKEQQLETPNRTGFVAVEWGGTEIK